MPGSQSGDATAEDDVTTIRAAERYNATGILVTAGQSIRVEASGEWTDWSVVTTAAGYEKILLRPFAPLRRVRSAPWFSLCGSVGASDAHLFAFEADGTTVAPASGPLYLFANDIWFMYWNNKGSLLVTVTTG